MAKLTANRSFVIEPFDQRAAIECALLLAESWDKATQGKVGRTKFKFDWQILAIALSRNATAIYSDDQDIHRAAKKLSVKVISIDQLPIPDSARQGKLELNPKQR